MCSSDLSKTAGKDKAPGTIYFARDNIGVSISAPKTVDVLALAKGLDAQIKRMRVLTKEAYEEALPKPEILSPVPGRVLKGSKSTIRYRNPSPDTLKTKAVATSEPIGAIVIGRGVKDAGVVTAVNRGRGRIGLAVYDPKTLLSRWITSEVIVIEGPE